MPEQTPLEIVGWVVDDFNATRGIAPGQARGAFADDVEIVPLRAMFEGTVFRGPNALDDFFAANREAWSSLRIDPRELRTLNGGDVLVVGTLHGTGRATGAQVKTPIALLFSVRDGLIRRAHTFTDEAQASAWLEAGRPEVHG